jgi:antitoxin VapB
MPINIKNEEVTRLANELARETGESVTVAVGRAVSERLARLHQKASRKGVAERLEQIGRECASLAPKEWLTWDYDADLYDEKGLPK